MNISFERALPTFRQSASYRWMDPLPSGLIQLAALIALFTLSACTAPSPVSRVDEADLDVPGQWAANGGSRTSVGHAWISRFNDRKLTSLVDEAVANNRDLQATEARIAAAEANAELAGVEMKPIINAALSGARQKQNFVGFPSFGTTGTTPAASTSTSTLSNRFGASLDLSWELDVWGRVRAGQSAAIARAEAAGADYAAARLSLAGQVAKSWFALTEARQQLALARETEEAFKDTEEVIQDRFESGQSDSSGTGAQLRLAKSDTASARASVELTGEQVASSLRQLELLLGRYPAGALKSTSTLPRLPNPPPAGLPSELLQRRPDFIAAERRFAASGALYKQAVLDYFPRFALTSGVGTSSGDLQDILNSNFGVWNLAGNIAQPIFSGGRLSATKRLRKAEEREVLANLQQTVLRGFAEVEIALASEDYLRRREQALEQAVSLASEAETESRDEYRDGVGDILTVLASQNAALIARSQLITVRRLRLDNRINLHLALGGDFRSRPPSPPVKEKQT